VCEKAWLGLISPLKVQEDFTYRDFIEVSKEMSETLYSKGCNYIIALTHMKTKNDRILAEQCQGYVDLVLGGHDHMSLIEQIGTVSLVKSGTDFEEFSDITIDKDTKVAKRDLVTITGEF
jgi:5'-nucleotidase